MAAVILKDGRVFSCGSVVLTTGTFLRGLIHIGNQKTPAGRVGEAVPGLSALVEIRPALGRAEDRRLPALTGGLSTGMRLAVRVQTMQPIRSPS